MNCKAPPFPYWPQNYTVARPDPKFPRQKPVRTSLFSKATKDKNTHVSEFWQFSGMGLKGLGILAIFTE